MPGIYGDLKNIARNSSMEFWFVGTNTTTSNAEGPTLWTLGVGTGSTLNVSRASTGQDTGTFCAGVVYTHVIVSDLHQVAAVLADMKGQRLSFSVKVASATAGVCRPFISEDGGVTRNYGNKNTGAGATTYEILKVDGIAISSSATAIWYGLEFNASGTVLIDSAALAYGSAAETAFTPHSGKSAAWTQTSGPTVRAIDMTLAVPSGSTIIAQALGTLVMDLQTAGILQ